ncbi:MAG: TonB-dependent receptor [Candidatus Acidiferrum sp.]
MKNPKLVFSLFVLLCLACILPAFPQSQLPNAHLTGTLTDPSGATVDGVKITAWQEGAPTAKPWSTVSSAGGAYTLALPPGRYQIRFSRQPFSVCEFSIQLASGESRALNPQLGLEPFSASVLVTAQAVPTTEQQTAVPNSIVTREEIDQRQSVALPDLLLYSPGIAVGRTGANGGTASIFLDGGNSNFTKVLVDGTPINPPGGAVDFSVLTLDNLDKVEIVRGAESAIYGTDAVSGAIQVFSHRGATRTPSLSAFAEGGSFSSGRGGAQFSGLVGRFDYSATGSYLQTDGQNRNSDFINRTYSGNFGYSFSETNQLRLSVRNNTGDAGVPGQTLFEPPSLHQRINQQVFSANVRWLFSTSPHWHHQIIGSESYTHQHNFNSQQSFYATDPFAFCPQANAASVPTAELCDFTYDDTYNYNRAGVSAQTSYIVRQFGVTAGYQYEVENASLSFLEQPHVRRNNQGGFVDLRFLPLSRVSLDLGARAEANASFGTRVVPRAGASVALRHSQSFWGDTRYRIFYGEGIKEPRFDQTYGTDPCDPGNPSLKPESSKNWSTGIDQKLASDRVKVSAEYFSNRFYDIVSFTFCAPGGPCPVTPPSGCPFGYGTYFNTDLARARGATIAVEARVAKWLFIAGNYTYDDSLVISSPNAFDPALVPGNRLIRRPPNSGSVTFNGTFRRFSATFAGYFTGQRTDSDFLGLGYSRNPGYARFDLSTNYAIYRGFSIYARATNLFDKQYQDALGYPALGRDARVGLRYQFAGRN